MVVHMKREAWKSIAVLTGICLVVAVLLSAVNHITARGEYSYWKHQS